jgi:hypothetical protein
MVPATIEFLEAVKLASEQGSDRPELPGGAMLVMVASSCVVMWLLASYIAEMHRFARTWNVLFIMIGLSLGLSILTIALLGGTV